MGKNWKPKMREDYWSVTCTGEVEPITWGYTVEGDMCVEYDELCYEFGNVFRTQELAEAAAEKVKETLATCEKG